MEITKQAHIVHIKTTCTNCERTIWNGETALTAYADGDYYKVLYTVCCLQCEDEINREDDV